MRIYEISLCYPLGNHSGDRYRKARSRYREKQLIHRIRHAIIRLPLGAYHVCEGYPENGSEHLADDPGNRKDRSAFHQRLLKVL